MTLTRNQKISVLIGIITIGFAAIVMFYYFRTFARSASGAESTFLTPLDASYCADARPHPALLSCSYGDFHWLTSGWHDSQLAGIGYGHVYYPAAYLLIAPFAALAYAPFAHAQILAITLLELLVTGFIFWLSCRQLKSPWPPETITRAFVCSFMTYPVLFELSTGNFEGLLFIALAIFFLLYQSGRVALGLPFLGLCIAMKALPGIFCVLLLADKNYRALAYLFLWVGFFTLLPLLLFHGGLWDGLSFIHNIKASQEMYFQLMVRSMNGNNWGHSLLNAVRIAYGQTKDLDNATLETYMALSLASFAALTFYIIKIEKTFWKRAALLVCAADLLPYTSTDYKLLHFYVPMFFFINQDESDGHDLAYAVLFGLLMIPKSYVYFYRLPYYNTNGVLNAAAMVALTGTIVWSGLRTRRAGTRVIGSMQP